MSKAVIYARFSSDNQREESIEGQLRECMAYAEKKDITVVDSYIDRAYSAKTDRRPAFQKMIRDSELQLFDTVLVWKLDRFARDRFDSAFYKKKLKDNGVHVESVMEHIGDTAESILLVSLLEGIAEYYSADLAEKVIRGHTENALKFKCNGGSTAFGLKLDEEHHYTIDPVKAPIVLELYQRYAAGETMKQLSDDLNRRKIRTINGNLFGLDTLRRMLSNRKYIGEYKYRDIVTPDAFPAIVPKELFEKVQEIREANKKAPARNKAEEKYLLSGKLFCGKCGTAMDGECGTSVTGNRYLYYKCLSAKRKRGCKKKAVRKELIERLVLTETVKLLDREGMIERIAEKILEFQGSENTVLPVLQSELAETEKSISNLIDAVHAGMFQPSMKGRLDELEARKSELNAQILQEQIRRPKFSREQILFWLSQFRDLDMNDEKQRQWLIGCFVNAVYVYDDKLLITFRTGDDDAPVLLNAAEKTEADHFAGSSDMGTVGGPSDNRLEVASKRFFHARKAGKILRQLTRIPDSNRYTLRFSSGSQWLRPDLRRSSSWKEYRLPSVLPQRS